MVRQDPAQLMQARLARAVAESLEARHPQAVHGPDVDDARGVAWCGRRFEEWSHELCDGEDPGEVQRQYAGPGGLGELGVWRAPVGAGVVDQDVQLGLETLEGFDHTLAIFEFVEICGDVMCASFAWEDVRCVH